MMHNNVKKEAIVMIRIGNCWKFICYKLLKYILFVIFLKIQLPIRYFPVHIYRYR